jgi:hypothetical protein
MAYSPSGVSGIRNLNYQTISRTILRQEIIGYYIHLGIIYVLQKDYFRDPLGFISLFNFYSWRTCSVQQKKICFYPFYYWKQSCTCIWCFFNTYILLIYLSSHQTVGIEDLNFQKCPPVLSSEPKIALNHKTLTSSTYGGGRAYNPIAGPIPGAGSTGRPGYQYKDTYTRYDKRVSSERRVISSLDAG